MIIYDQYVAVGLMNLLDHNFSISKHFSGLQCLKTTREMEQILEEKKKHFQNWVDSYIDAPIYWGLYKEKTNIEIKQCLAG